MLEVVAALPPPRRGKPPHAAPRGALDQTARAYAEAISYVVTEMTSEAADSPAELSATTR